MGRILEQPRHLNFDAITDGPFQLDDMPVGSLLNVIDLQTAMAIIRPSINCFCPTMIFMRVQFSFTA